MRGVNPRALALIAVLAVATVGVVAIAGGAALADDGSPSTAVDDTAASTAGTGTVAASALLDHEGSESPEARLACTNGTSEAVVECGYNPGPTTVELGEQWTFGDTLTVDAVELNGSGFVAVHRVSFVDGAFTDSIVGVSAPLSAGLHRDVEVPVDDRFRQGGERTLIAVAYRDSDDDGTFEFASSDGATDRPYTNTYSPETGNVTDEAGDVIGDHASVSVVQFVNASSTGPPTNLDSDPMLEDLNGDGRGSFADVLVYNRVRKRAVVQDNPLLFDFDGDGVVGTPADSAALFDEVEN